MDIDEEIKRALSKEDQAFAKQFEEMGPIGQFKSIFQGKMGWISTASLIFGTILQVIFFYAVWKFFTIDAVDALNDKLHWGGIAWFTAIMLGFMKVWMFIRMDGNRVTREIKRVELQIARMQINQ